MYTPSEANKKRRNRGKFLREEILNYLEGHPNSTSYQIAKYFDLDPSTIKHHVNKIIDKSDKLSYSIQIIDNKTQILYTLQTDLYKLYIEDFDTLHWNESYCYLYLTSSNDLTIDSKTNDELDKICLMRLLITLKQDKNGIYFILPNNLVHFFNLRNPNFEIKLEQSITYFDEKNTDIGTLLIQIEKKL